ncbi:hypothetical protein BDP27DRAFT_1428542 [Rhodocollybia butyracea]|uniref:Uncharacterized protein n=1 Tax=Rhodocollybia butyracea TaxID=206335 RepID=A0A9P5PBB3_9AGAR|nr:hypothetical protein BDP27DRAFT_1428542 [Rhodocollybia butyracea]
MKWPREDSVYFVIYGFVDILNGLILTGMLASRLWWLNRQTEKLLGKPSGAALGNFTEIFLESGLLMPVFLGVALALNVTVSGSNGLLNLQNGPEILSLCALTQVAAIASTLILVRIGLGVDVQPSEGKGHTNMDNRTELFAPDLEQAIINIEDSNPATIHPFSLKYNDLPPGSATFMPAEQGSTTVRPFSLK